MLTEYVDEALRRATYETISDEQPFYGEIADLPGINATGGTLEECRQSLKDAVEGWILVSVKHDLPIPRLGDFEIQQVAAA